MTLFCYIKININYYFNWFLQINCQRHDSLICISLTPYTKSIIIIIRETESSFTHVVRCHCVSSPDFLPFSLVWILSVYRSSIRTYSRSDQRITYPFTYILSVNYHKHRTYKHSHTSTHTLALLINLTS